MKPTSPAGENPLAWTMTLMTTWKMMMICPRFNGHELTTYERWNNKAKKSLKKDESLGSFHMKSFDFERIKFAMNDT